MKNMRKQYQRKLNQLIHKANKQLLEDDEFLGRFYVLQRGVHWFKFDDNSGGIMNVHLRCYDRHTGYYKDYMYDYAPYYVGSRWHLFEILNKFLVEDLNWKHNGVDSIDYRNIPRPQTDTRENNWFLNYKHWKKEQNELQ